MKRTIPPYHVFPLQATIQEKHINITLSKYLDQNVIFDGTQFGFRNAHSTESALIVVAEEISDIMDNGGKAAAVLFDLFVAFNTVRHSVLLQMPMIFCTLSF